MSMATSGENAPGNRSSLPDFSAARKSARFCVGDFWENNISKSSKHQHPTSREIPSVQAPSRAACSFNWMLKFGASLDVGAWNLELHSGSVRKCHVYLSRRKLIVRAAKQHSNP